jgi:predicted nucleic acid-binding protein
MIDRVFIDSDIILDVATARKPFVENSRRVLLIVESGKALGMISSNSVTNIYYILRKLSSSKKAKDFIRSVVSYLSVIAVIHNNNIQALDSGFGDFEVAVQYYSALNHQCSYIVTRNIDDYKDSDIPVLEPKEFIALFENYK